MSLGGIGATLLELLNGMLTSKSVRVHLQPVKGVHVTLYPLRGVRRARKARKRATKPKSD